jgi:hypothetical protein
MFVKSGLKARYINIVVSWKAEGLTIYLQMATPWVVSHVRQVRAEGTLHQHRCHLEG